MYDCTIELLLSRLGQIKEFVDSHSKKHNDLRSSIDELGNQVDPESQGQSQVDRIDIESSPEIQAPISILQGEETQDVEIDFEDVKIESIQTTTESVGSLEDRMLKEEVKQEIKVETKQKEEKVEVEAKPVNGPRVKTRSKNGIGSASLGMLSFQTHPLTRFAESYLNQFVNFHKPQN